MRESWQEKGVHRRFSNLQRSSPDKPPVGIEQAGRHDTFEPRGLEHDGKQIGRVSDRAEQFNLLRVRFQLKESYRVKHFPIAAGNLVAQLGSKAEVARELAYRLYTICQRKKRAQEALSYNGLVQSWPEITRLASEKIATRITQPGMFAEV